MCVLPWCILARRDCGETTLTANSAKLVMRASSCACKRCRYAAPTVSLAVGMLIRESDQQLAVILQLQRQRNHNGFICWRVAGERRTRQRGIACLPGVVSEFLVCGPRRCVSYHMLARARSGRYVFALRSRAVLVNPKVSEVRVRTRTHILLGAKAASLPLSLRQAIAQANRLGCPFRCHAPRPSRDYTVVFE